MSRESSLALGVIGRPRGLHGDVFVTVFNRDSRQLISGASFLLTRAGEDAQERTLVHCAPAGKRERYVVRWEGVNSRTEAEALVGMTILIDRERLEEPEPDEFYYHDVLGYRVEQADGGTLGTVHKVFSGATDILIVHDERLEWMIPVVRDVILDLDHEEKRFLVAIPDGLEPSPKKG